MQNESPFEEKEEEKRRKGARERNGESCH